MYPALEWKHVQMCLLGMILHRMLHPLLLTHIKTLFPSLRSSLHVCRLYLLDIFAYSELHRCSVFL